MRSYHLPEDDGKRPDVGLGGVAVISKCLRSGRAHPDLLVHLGNELVVLDSTCSGEVSQLNDEVDVDIEAVR